jgi:hypothetical protein
VKPAARVFLYVFGTVLVASGGLFILQGADIVHWPANSFMLGVRQWIENGIVIVLAGAAMLAAARFK